MNLNAAIMANARRYLGVKEFPGSASNPAVEAFFARAGHPGVTDDVPWCAAFAGAVLAESGATPSGSLMARSYARWGAPVSSGDEKPGDVVVLARGKPPSGHVAFFVRYDGSRVSVIGGNQSDAVTETSFPVEQVVAIRRADAAANVGKATLRRGSKGAFVLDLQERLRSLNYFLGKLDGDFGSLTHEAVMGFQADNGLEADGIVGPRTWTALDTAKPRPRRNVTEADLRASGSRTVTGADKAQVGTAAIVTLGAGTALVDRAEEAVGAIERAQGVAARIGGFGAAVWPVAAMLVIGLVVWYLMGRVKAARVDDAQTGANDAR